MIDGFVSENVRFEKGGSWEGGGVGALRKFLESLARISIWVLSEKLWNSVKIKIWCP